MHSALVSAVAVLALASKVVLAQTAGFDPISVPSQDQNVVAGSNLTITWAPSPTGYDNDTISITLLYGADPATLILAPAPIASGIPNYLGSHIFTVPTNNLSATYGFKITLDQQTSIFQYSNPFHITGGTLLVPSTSASSSLPVTITHTIAPNPTYSANSTTASVVTVTNSSSIATTTASASVPVNSSNATMTLSSTLVVKTTTSASATKTPATTTTSAAPSATSSGAAVANMATGGFAALGGLILAFAL